MKAIRSHAAVVASLAALLAAASAAQQPPQTPSLPPGQREPGQPGPEGRRLAFLLGAWEEKVSYPGEAAEQKAEEGTGRWFARPALGRYIQFNYEGTSPQGAYRAFGVLTYDRESQSYRLWWFDDQGGVGDYRGTFVDENTLSLEHRGKVEGRDFRERISYTRVSLNQVRTKIEQAWDSGEYKVYLDALANRTGNRPLGPARRGREAGKPPEE